MKSSRRDRDRDRDHDYRQDDRHDHRDYDRDRRDRDRDRDRDRGRDRQQKDRDRRKRSRSRTPEKQEPKPSNDKKPSLSSTDIKNIVKAEIKEEKSIEKEVKKVEPLSLEEILEKKKKDEEARSKPVFITKEQRAAEALKRRQEEVAAMRAAQSSNRFPSTSTSDIQYQTSEPSNNRDRDSLTDKNRDDKYDRRDRDSGRRGRYFFFILKFNLFSRLHIIITV